LIPRRLWCSIAVSLECWVNLSASLGTWCRVFDFGNESAGAGGLTYIFLSPHTGTPSTRTVLSEPDNSEAVLDIAGTLDGFNGQLVVVFDTVHDTQTLYTNGVLSSSASLNGKVLTAVNDLDCWIGKSLYSADAGLNASIDEFRIYAGALSATQVAADYTAGPDKVVLPPPVAAGPRLTAAISGNNIVVSWPASAGGSLQSALTVAPAPAWTPVQIQPVVVNGFNQVTVPMSGQASYFRLVQ
jgi:hypothetical protein